MEDLSLSHKRLDAKPNCDNGVKLNVDQIGKCVDLAGRQGEHGRSKRQVPRGSEDGACRISFGEVIMLSLLPPNFELM